MRNKPSPIACDMTAIAPEQRAQHMATIKKLFGLVEKVQELPDGYSFKLPNDSEVVLMAAEFIALERLCCPFLDFAIDIERKGGPFWLSLIGVKPFIMAEVGDHLTASCVLKRFSGNDSI